MSERRIRRALIAVYDKTDVAEFARALHGEFCIEIISTGGTAKALQDAGIPVTLVEQVTGVPELLDGRVKTLHPAIHAAILADRDNPGHVRQLAELGVEPIDMVVVNLYPFEKTVADPACTFEQAIEMIDIGGPCLLRAAAKNHRHVLAVPGAGWYARVLELLRTPDTQNAARLRVKLAAAVFGQTRQYDIGVMNYLIAHGWEPALTAEGAPAAERRPVADGGTVSSVPATGMTPQPTAAVQPAAGTPAASAPRLPSVLVPILDQCLPFRYGENPHQAAACYRHEGQDAAWLVEDDAAGVALSYNNALDADAALCLCAELARGFNRSTVLGHTNGPGRANRASYSNGEGSARLSLQPPSNAPGAREMESDSRSKTPLPSGSACPSPTDVTFLSASARIAVFVKHTNACGVGVAAVRDDSPSSEAAAQVEAYRRAYLGDPNAAMGGILAVNFPVAPEFAVAVMETFERHGKPLRDAGAAHAPGGFFIEVWVAPTFTDDAVALIRQRKVWGKNVRLLTVGDMCRPLDADALLYRSIVGGMLAQTPDVVGLNQEQWNTVTNRAPTESEMADLWLAWLIAKHTKSNAISLVKDGMLIGNGAGQMSRVMSCRIATWLARENGHAGRLRGVAAPAGNPWGIAPGTLTDGPVAASDAFFPFRDGPDLLIEAGVTAIIQPGGSKRDADTIAACNERGVAMIFTGTRHFRH